jgi:uncharacterized protein YjbI with pentapeptide repeats
MIKKIALLIFLITAFSGVSVYAAKPADVKKLNQFLKKDTSTEPLDLSGADMRDYDLNAPGKSKELRGANMKGANFSCQKIRGMKFENVDLEGANFENADLSGVSFRDCNLSKANFKGVSILFGGFRNTDLSGANFTEGRFESVGFDKLKMVNAIFDDADFFRVSLVDVDREGASFKNIKTRDCSGFFWIF